MGVFATFLAIRGFILYKTMNRLFLLPLLMMTMQAQDSSHEGRVISPAHRQHLARTLLVRQLILDQYDQDKSGQLDDAERANLKQAATKARQVARERFRSRLDANKDGKLSPEERAAGMKSHHRNRHGGDGTAPPPRPEGGALPSKGQAPEGKGRGPHKAPLLFFLAQQLLLNQFDANHNGMIDPDEHVLLQKRADALFETHRAELLAKYDRNHDSKLSEEERAMARASLASEEQGDAEIDDEEFNNLIESDLDTYILTTFEDTED